MLYPSQHVQLPAVCGQNAGEKNGRYLKARICRGETCSARKILTGAHSVHIHSNTIRTRAEVTMFWWGFNYLRSISSVTCFGVRGCQYIYVHACIIFRLARCIHIYMKIYENVSLFFCECECACV